MSLLTMFFFTVAALLLVSAMSHWPDNAVDPAWINAAAGWAGLVIAFHIAFFLYRIGKGLDRLIFILTCPPEEYDSIRTHPEIVWYVSGLRRVLGDLLKEYRRHPCKRRGK